jgi:N-glycosylase/DNA lyase
MSPAPRPRRQHAYRDIDALRREYAEKRTAIRARLAEFRRKWREDDEHLFEEVAYCILAIQTKARASDAAVQGLKDRGLLLDGEAPAIAEFLRPRIRFHNHKAAYLVAARDRFRPGGRWALKATLAAFPSPEAARDWLVREVHGFSMKEASHLLRNIGFSDRLAILDRHVLRNLARHGVVRSVPTSLTPRRYLEIEDRWRAFADAVGIPLAELDLLFFSRGAGAILK